MTTEHPDKERLERAIERGFNVTDDGAIHPCPERTFMLDGDYIHPDIWQWPEGFRGHAEISQEDAEAVAASWRREFPPDRAASSHDEGSQ